MNGKQTRITSLNSVINPRTKKEIQDEFLKSFSECASIKHACLSAKVSRSTILHWSHFDEEFKLKYEETIEHVCSMLEDEAIRRAMRGWDKPVFHNGKHVGNIREYSDTLLIFLMKGWMPNKYRDKLHVEKNTNTSNTLLIMPSNGRELTDQEVTLELPSGKRYNLPARMQRSKANAGEKRNEDAPIEIRDEDIPNISINPE